MIDLIVHKQNEEIKERLERLEDKLDRLLNHSGYKEPVIMSDGNIGYATKAITIQSMGQKGPNPEDEHYFVQEELKPTPEVINVEVPSLKGQYKVILKEKEYDPKVSIDIDPEILDKPTHKKKGK